ncbi:sulfurtransferase [Rhodohalobacter mucosus]|uniref:Sulfurtransferase n=1 Tax=Rhodohalobacter mucosus TaxID=2079485 RepID=A0A316TRJ3_9BACT|nr:sulfurtransferase [Rhodohalobacter mucosus]PWN05919.1 hypothetical protein DDZ15_12090 [Rhodohalobacter mucosus]
MKVKYIVTFLLPLLLITACSQQVDQPLTDYPNSELLISAAELNEQINGGDDPVVIDTRAEEPDSLIPGAVHFQAVSELIDPDHPVESYLIGPEAFEEKMRALGLDNEDRLVLYDGGNSLAAARLFYALDYYGFSNAAILNGGFEAWMEEALPFAKEPESPESGMFTVAVQEAKICDINYIVEASNDPDKIIFDVRSPEEYRGETDRAEKNGHIPNAINLEWNNLIESEGVPYFLSAAEIQDKLNAMGITWDKEIITHCQSNVRGSHAYFTLRLMGYDSVRAYEGSWSEYGNSSETVVQSTVSE